MRLSALLLVAPAVMVMPRPAEACSPPLCTRGAFLPGNGATIPSNAPGLYWRPTHDWRAGTQPDPKAVRLTTTADPTTPLPFTATALQNGDYVIVPGMPLVQGTSYVLEDPTVCDVGTVKQTFTVGAAAGLPEALGAVQLIGHGSRGKIDVASFSGSCSTEIDVTSIGIELAPSAELAPWMPLLLFETIVDGQAWQIQPSIGARPAPGASWKGKGKDLLFRTCVDNPDASFTGMSEGGHQVAFRATLPNGASALVTPAQAVELMCDDPIDPDPDPDHDGGCSTGGAASLGAALLGLLALRRRRR